MATIFPLSASVGQVYNGYEFDGVAWNIIGVDLTQDYATASDLSAHESDTTNVHGISDSANLVYNSQLSNYLTLSSASATYLNQSSASTIYLNQSSASATYAPISTTVTTSGNQTLTNKTLTSPNIDYGLMRSPEEIITVSASSATGTINFDLLTHGILYYTSNSASNFAINFRADGSTALNSILSNGQSITALFLNTNGGTAYYPTIFRIDGTGVTPRWSGGSAPTSGNANSIDAYSFSIIKTANATFTVLAGAARFA